MTDIESVKKAMKNGNVLAVSNALKENFSNLSKPTNNGTLLHSACRVGCKLEICKALIDNGFDVNSTEGGYGVFRGLTPLHFAASNGHYNICELLIERGAAVDPIRKGESPLVMAARKGHARICAFLIDKGARVTGLSNAALGGHLDVCKLLVERGHIVPGVPALIYAAEEGHLDVCKFLLDNGAEVNARNDFRSTPLHKAAKFGHLKVVELLVNRGANLNAVDNNGIEPYKDARKFKKVFKFLLDKMDPSIKKDEMKWAIDDAVWHMVQESRKSVDPEFFRKEVIARLGEKRLREEDHIVPSDSDSGSDSDSESEEEWVTDREL